MLTFLGLIAILLQIHPSQRITGTMENSIPHRIVKVAAVQLWVEEHYKKDDNVRNALAMIDKAAEQKPDIIVLPENVPGLGTKQLYWAVAESVPGRLTQQVSAKARQYQCYIIFPMIEQRATKIFNAAVIFDRNGEIVGIYHKVHEPEVIVKEQGVDLGSEFPVFDLDFGKIGIMICWDNTFPETASILALKGAEIIFFPHLIPLPSQLNFNVTTRARAVDNCVFVVAAGTRSPSEEYSWVDEGLSGTCMIDRDGKVLCQTDKNESQVIVQEFDLSEPRIVKNLGVWGEVDWKQQYLKERRPELYKAIIKP